MAAGVKASPAIAELPRRARLAGHDAWRSGCRCRKARGPAGRCPCRGARRCRGSRRRSPAGGRRPRSRASRSSRPGRPGRARLISSQVFQPTSPSQTSLVPGRIVMRNGLRRPEAMIRRTLAVAGWPRWDCPASASPGVRVRGAGRRRPVRWDRREVRTSWLRSAPPSAVGGASTVAGTARRIAARVDGAAVLAVVGEVEARAVAAGHVQRPVGAERECADRVARDTAGTSPRPAPARLPVMTSPAACSRDSRPEITQPSSVAPGGVGQPSDVAPAEPQRGAVPPIAASCAYST